MKIIDSRSLKEPVIAYSNPDHKRMSFRDPEHVPYNKRKHEIKSSISFLDIGRCPREEDGGWLSLCVSETTTSDKGNTQSRTIQITLSMDEAKRIAEFINTGE